VAGGTQTEPPRSARRGLLASSATSLADLADTFTIQHESYLEAGAFIQYLGGQVMLAELPSMYAVQLGAVGCAYARRGIKPSTQRAQRLEARLATFEVAPSDPAQADNLRLHHAV